MDADISSRALAHMFDRRSEEEDRRAMADCTPSRTSSYMTEEGHPLADCIPDNAIADLVVYLRFLHLAGWPWILHSMTIS